MSLYDDTAAAALNVAAAESLRLGASRYGTQHVLLGLLRTGDPVTRCLTSTQPALTVDAVRAIVEVETGTPAAGPARTRRTPGPVPAREFHRAMSQATAKERHLVGSGRLRARSRLGCGELWLAVLEPSTTSSGVLRSLGADPDELRAVVLTTMVRGSRPVPPWPQDVPAGKVPMLVDGLLNSLLAFLPGR